MSQLQPVHDHLLCTNHNDEAKSTAGPGATEQQSQGSSSIQHTNQTSKLMDEKAARALGVVSAAAELSEAGIIGTEVRHGERVGRVRLGVAEEDIRLALGDDIDVKGLVVST